MADNEEDLVDYDEEEEEENVAAEKSADAEGKEVKKVVFKLSSQPQPRKKLVKKPEILIVGK